MFLSCSKVARNLKVLHLLFLIYCFKPTTKARLFGECDQVIYIKQADYYLESPNYIAGSSCRYKFIAPLDHIITVHCTINLAKGANACSTEHFLVARDGDEYLRESELFCGSGTFERKTLFRTLVLAYKSGGFNGNFTCKLHVQKRPCDCGWSINTKIVNGEEAYAHEFPSMVALRDLGTNQPLYCSGNIISHRHILTAAHCGRFQSNPAYIIALVGHHTLEKSRNAKYAAFYYIDRIIEHPGYTDQPPNNDIAILVTKKDIEYSRGVGPICLPPYTNVNNNFDYNFVDVVGWGSTRFAGPISSTLQKVHLAVTTNKVCAEAFQGAETIYPTQICTMDTMNRGSDSCQFDSGGPVVLRRNRQFIIGIVSYGKGCGIGKSPTGINTRITSYLLWIYQNTGFSTCNVPAM